ncbi:MAG: AraC family transcriptional regulator [Myxococcales bacterium]|nr:AraC family transcriptional regulator [Myxococcales bacterium]
MLYLSRKPGPPLGRFVEKLWHLQDVPLHQRERVLPEGTLELVLNLAEDEIHVYDPNDPTRVDRHSGAVVSGAFDRSFGIDTRAHASIIGAHFRPGGAFPFFGLPLNELAGSHVDLASLWGGGAAELRGRLCAATTVADRFRILEAALVGRLGCGRPRHRVVPHVIAQLQAGETRVGELADNVGLSHRRLIEVFRAEVGMTPKRFARIKRFERAVTLLRRDASADWADLALRCGYFDQPHMIGDFVSLSGFTPVALRRQARGELKDGHVLG